MNLHNILKETLSSFLLKAREYMYLNTDYLQNSKESISSLNRWCDKTISYSIEYGSGKHITALRRKRDIVNNCLPDPRILKEYINEYVQTHYEISYRYYSPNRNIMCLINNNIEFNKPIVRFNYNYLKDMLSLRSLSPMRFGELSMQSRLWTSLQRLTESLNSTLTAKYTQSLVNLMTIQSKDGTSFVCGNFYALVKFGFYTVVWFRYIPVSGIEALPVDLFPEDYVDLFPEDYDVFFNERANVTDYSKVVFVETKDLTPVVLSAFQNDYPFNEMLGPIPDTENPHKSKWLLSMGLGIMICFCLSVGVLPDINEITLY